MFAEPSLRERAQSKGGQRLETLVDDSSGLKFGNNGEVVRDVEWVVL